MLRTRAAALLVALVALACNRDVPGVEVTIDEPSRQTVGGVQFVELFQRGASDTSPLLVGLHGRGDTAENFASAWHGVPAKLEIALALAPLPFASGRQWFERVPGMTEDALADAVSDAEERLWPAIAELARGRKIFLVGFSQGAMLAYLMAVRHPDAIAYAFPIAGRMPDKLFPRGDISTAPVYALHGTEDKIIGIDASREAIASFKAVGAIAELHEFPGIGHTLAPAMRDAILSRMRAVIENL
jgi:phospholipase/carboxylesterase